MIFKRKKNSRQRASKTHGCGSMKKRRGAGHRGGRGNAGSGKRGDGKKPSFWSEKRYGKSGFKTKGTVEVKPINLQAIENMLASLKLEKKGDVYELDLSKLGYNKLLSKGKVINKFKITVDICSEKALQKIKDAGGEVVTLVQGATGKADDKGNAAEQEEAPKTQKED